MTTEGQFRNVPHEDDVVRLYARGELSSGRAAQLLGISRWEFLDRLGHHGVTYFDDQINQDEAMAAEQINIAFGPNGEEHDT